MPMERAVEEVNSGGVPLSFDFDSAFWVSGLSPVDPARGVARVDARSLAIPAPAHDVVPEVVPPVSAEQTDPSVEEGQAWAPRAGSEAAPRNAFEATLTGARAVRLDLARMRIAVTRRIDGSVSTDAPLRLELLGQWTGPVRVSVDGSDALVERLGKGVIAISVPAGKHSVIVG
jgi:hypothetical protein